MESQQTDLDTSPDKPEMSVSLPKNKRRKAPRQAPLPQAVPDNSANFSTSSGPIPASGSSGSTAIWRVSLTPRGLSPRSQDPSSPYVRACSTMQQSRVVEMMVSARPLFPNASGAIVTLVYLPPGMTRSSNLDPSTLAAMPYSVSGSATSTLELTVPNAELIRGTKQGWTNTRDPSSTQGVVVLVQHGQVLNPYTNGIWNGGLFDLSFKFTSEFAARGTGTKPLKRIVGKESIVVSTDDQSRVVLDSPTARYMSMENATGFSRATRSAGFLGPILEMITCSLDSVLTPIAGAVSTLLSGGGLFMRAKSGDTRITNLAHFLYADYEDAQNDRPITAPGPIAPTTIDSTLVIDAVENSSNLPDGLWSDPNPMFKIGPVPPIEGTEDILDLVNPFVTYDEMKVVTFTTTFGALTVKYDVPVHTYWFQHKGGGQENAIHWTKNTEVRDSFGLHKLGGGFKIAGSDSDLWCYPWHSQHGHAALIYCGTVLPFFAVSVYKIDNWRDGYMAWRGTSEVLTNSDTFDGSNRERFFGSTVILNTDARAFVMLNPYLHTRDGFASNFVLWNGDKSSYKAYIDNPPFARLYEQKLAGDWHSHYMANTPYNFAVGYASNQYRLRLSFLHGVHNPLSRIESGAGCHCIDPLSLDAKVPHGLQPDRPSQQPPQAVATESHSDATSDTAAHPGIYGWAPSSPLSWRAAKIDPERLREETTGNAPYGFNFEEFVRDVVRSMPSSAAPSVCESANSTSSRRRRRRKNTKAAASDRTITPPVQKLTEGWQLTVARQSLEAKMFSGTNIKSLKDTATPKPRTPSPPPDLSTVVLNTGTPSQLPRPQTPYLGIASASDDVFIESIEDTDEETDEQNPKDLS
uniref:Pro-secreted protein ORF2 n=1 Tax=Fish-associated hepevirus TaxID=3003971 RepID=A0A9E9G0K4_9VIRU|nr:MAG: capsid protein [Fish-associated hepevirus]